MTLLELIVAITASGIVLLGARLLFEQVADGADRVARAAGAADRVANGEARFHETLWNARDLGPGVHDPNASPLMGDESAMQFTSWCSVPEGWTEACSVTLRLEEALRNGDSLDTRIVLTRTLEQHAADVGTALTMTVLVLPGRRRLLYLETAEEGGVWRSSWRQQEDGKARLPRALGIAGEHDTLIARIGGFW